MIRIRITESSALFGWCVAAAAAGLLFAPVTAQAAGLFLSPPSGVYEVDDVFSVRVMLDPGEFSVNAAEGEIVIPDGVTVEQISTDRSVFTIWTEQPSFDGSDRRIFFSGGRTAPVSGNSQELFTLRLRSLETGVRQVRLASGAVMAADGAGTNVISTLASGTYTFVVPPEERDPEPEYVAPAGAPPEPRITSSTHPDEDMWYQADTVRFSWDLPEDVYEVRAELNQRSAAVPQEIREGALRSMTFEDVVDGVWYFHLQVRNSAGWSELSSRRVQVDSTAPDRFTIVEYDRDDRTDPVITLALDAHDAVSGIDRFSFFIDGVYDEAFSGSKHEVSIGPLPPGVHTLVARAYNRSGLSRVESLVVEVRPLETPRFTEIPDIVHSGSIFALRGETFPDATVVISLQRRGEEAERHTVQAGSTGMFTFIAPRRLDDGIYSVQVKATDERGAESQFSDPVTVAVQQPGIVRIGSLAVNALSVVVSLVAISVLFIFTVTWSHHKWSVFRRRLNKEIQEAEEEVHSAFETIRRKAAEQIDLLRKAEKMRKLTDEEKAIKSYLESDLDRLESGVEKEVHDIEEEMRRGR